MRSSSFLLVLALALPSCQWLNPAQWGEGDSASREEKWDALEQARAARNPVYVPPRAETSAVRDTFDFAMELLFMAALALLLTAPIHLVATRLVPALRRR